MRHLRGLDVTRVLRSLAAAAVLVGLILTPLHAALAAGCAEVARSVAASNSDARILSVEPIQRDGVAQCRITLLIKSSDGGPARKKTVVVPQ